MMLAEAPLPAEATGRRLPEHMQRRVDALTASNVESLLESHLLSVSESHVNIPGVTMAEAQIMKRPSLSIDKTASVGINVVGYKDGSLHAEAIIRVEAVDTKDPNVHGLVVAYFDRSSINSRQHRWVTMMEHAYDQQKENLDDYSAVSIDRTDPAQIADQQEKLKFQVEIALDLARHEARPAREKPSGAAKEVDIVEFIG